MIDDELNDIISELNASGGATRASSGMDVESLLADIEDRALHALFHQRDDLRALPYDDRAWAREWVRRSDRDASR